MTGQKGSSEDNQGIGEKVVLFGLGLVGEFAIACSADQTLPPVAHGEIWLGMTLFVGFWWLEVLFLLWG